MYQHLIHHILLLIFGIYIEYIMNEKNFSGILCKLEFKKKICLWNIYMEKMIVMKEIKLISFMYTYFK